MKPTSKVIASAALLITGIGAVLFFLFGRSLWRPFDKKIVGTRSVIEVVQDIGSPARSRMQKFFKSAGVRYPPNEVALLALKDSALLELWVGPEHSPVFIRSYEIKALSGIKGPKLREGDRQVPEGIYEIEGFNPNSRFHLSLKLNYPNPFDLKHAKDDGRHEPGSNIFIHGKAVSIGCLAIGDEAIEELFVLAYDVGRSHIKVVIAPSDPRNRQLSADEFPTWVAELYRAIEAQFHRYLHTES